MLIVVFGIGQLKKGDKTTFETFGRVFSVAGADMRGITPSQSAPGPGEKVPQFGIKCPRSGITVDISCAVSSDVGHVSCVMSSDVGRVIRAKYLFCHLFPDSAHPIHQPH